MSYKGASATIGVGEEFASRSRIALFPMRVHSRATLQTINKQFRERVVIVNLLALRNFVVS